MLAVKHEYGQRPISTRSDGRLAEEKKQTPRAVERFWRQVLVSAINEELDRMAAAHGLQVLCPWVSRELHYYEMGVPTVPLASLYSADAWAHYEAVKFAYRSPVELRLLRMAA